MIRVRDFDRSIDFCGEAFQIADFDELTLAYLRNENDFEIERTLNKGTDASGRVRAFPNRG